LGFRIACAPHYKPYVARVYGLYPVSNCGLFKRYILLMAEYSLCLSPSAKAQAHDQRTDNPLKSAA